MANRKLTTGQKRFITEYIKNPNATQAAIKAGYSKHTAKVQGAQLLSKLNFEIQKRLEKKESRDIADENEVLRFLTAVMRGEVEEEQIIIENKGDYISQARKMRRQVQARDRLKAGESLAKRYGLLSERIEVDTASNIVLQATLSMLESRDIENDIEQDDYEEIEESVIEGVNNDE